MTDAVIAMNAAKQLPGVNKGGRPDTVSEATVAKAEYWLAERVWEDDGRIVPTVEGLARYLDLSRITLYQAEELSNTLEKVQALQSEMVLDRSLANEFNPTIAKLILSAKHGYIERSEVSNTHELVAKPSQVIASDFSDYVKAKTEALPSTTQEPESKA